MICYALRMVNINVVLTLQTRQCNQMIRADDYVMGETRVSIIIFGFVPSLLPCRNDWSFV